MTIVTANHIYEELLNGFDIKNKSGSIEINLGGITAKYNAKDAIGDLLQDWIREWLVFKKYYFRTPTHSQKFPDFLLSTSDGTDFLEIKTFNAKASPAFDIANFDAYCKSLLILPERIDADYLILSYTMVNKVLSIKDIWLKKVWQISSSSEKNSIRLQIKEGFPYNLRPCIWYSTRADFKPFANVHDFLDAISNTHTEFGLSNSYSHNWLQNVKDKYLQNTGKNL